jgi:hypothetical protein
MGHVSPARKVGMISTRVDRAQVYLLFASVIPEHALIAGMPFAN